LLCNTIPAMIHYLTTGPKQWGQLMRDWSI
jgi:hypothetical protein